jgi:osmoprotectant transport system substrate-binding protein
MRTRTARFMLPVALLGLTVAACGGDDGDSTEPTDDASSTEAAAPEGPTIKMRGQAFSESVTIAEVYGQYLEGKGYDVDILTEAGFRDEALTGLEATELDLIIDYIGGTQASLAPDAPSTSDPAEVSATIAPLLSELGATLLDFSPAVDGDAYVVRGDLDATTISDTAGAGLVLGASAQCFERPQCFIGLTDPEIYGIEFADTRTLEFGPLLGEALAAQEVDVVIWNTTAPQIEADGFKVLEDDQGLFPAQNIAPIVRTDVLDAYGDQLSTDLNDLSAMITTDDLLAWNTETDIELRESDDVATEWLTEKGLL